VKFLTVRRLRTALTIATPVAVFAIALLGAPSDAAHPVVAQATSSPQGAVPTPGVGNLPPGVPTPYPVATLAPAGEGALLPYPAYGTPVPGVQGVVPGPDSGLPNTISLSQAQAIGFARSPSLAVARGNANVAAAEAQLAATGLNPDLSGSANISRTVQQTGALSTTGGSGSATRAGIGSFTASSLDLTLTQLIWDGGHLAAGVKAAQHTHSADVDSFLFQLQTVAENVAASYYNYLAAERTVQVDVEIVQQDVVQENLIRAQVQAGTAAKIDIATAQVATAQARLALIQAQGSELSAQASFANVLGLDARYNIQPIDDAPVFTNSPVSTVPIQPYDLAIKRALLLRPDYASALQNYTAAQYSLKEARLTNFPTLNGTGETGTGSTNPGGGAYRNSSTIGAALTLPIFDQGVRAANSAQAKAQLDIAAANLQTSLLTVQLSVKQALSNLVSASAALDQAQVSYTTALVVLQATQAQYRAGVTTLPLLLNAQVGLTTALGAQVNAVYALRQAEQAYLFALGSNYDVSKMKP
jgi:outer membrane protein TolC